MNAVGVVEAAASERISFTSSDDLKSVKLYDSTVEIIGYVNNVNASRNIKSHNIFTFTLNNDDDEIVQVTVWNNEIERIEPHIKCHEIIHLDGIYSKPIEKKYNKGTVSYELIVQSNTVINVLGTQRINSADTSSLTPTTVLLKDAGLTGGYIRVKASLKSAFGLIVKQISTKSSCGCGSITDGEYKLEVQITSFYEDCKNTFVEGQHLELTGTMQCSANPVYLLVNKLSDIKLYDEKQDSFSFLLKGIKPIPSKKKQIEYNHSDSSKALKSD